jgi:gliding motility-associated-like protein
MVRLMTIVLFMLLLTLVSAKAQTVVYQGTTTTLEVVSVPGNTYDWELYSDPAVNFATVQGNCPATSAKFVSGNTGASVNVLWLQPGIYFYKITAHNAVQCTNNLKFGMLKVIINIDAVISGAVLTGACQQMKLDASKSIGDIIKYEWSVLDTGGALTQQTGLTTEFLLSPSFTGALPADFRVRLHVTNRTGETDSDTIKIKVDRPPVAQINSKGQPERDGSMVVDGTTSSGSALSYKWSTSQGKIVGPDNQPTAKLMGEGIYTLEVVDMYGCKSSRTFKFPIELFQVTARPDYARTSWAQDTTVNVLANDKSSVALIPGTVHVIQPPSRVDTKVNPDGSVTYTPIGRLPGRDTFIYEVCDVVNQCASATVTIDIYDAGLKIPEAFSPNGDGLNEHLVFKGLENYPKSHIHIYTRSGQLVYQSDDYLNDWDGRTFKSALTSHELVPTGVYYYILELGGTTRSIKGFIYIAY